MGEELAAHLAWLRASGRTEESLKGRKSVVCAFGRHLEPSGLLDATETDVILWLDNPELALTTRRTYHANLAAFYEWCVRRDYITRSPLRDLPKPRAPRRPPRPLPDADLERALTAARPRTRIWLILARYAGLRALEVAQLRPDDIDWNGNVFTVHGKGQKDATLPMHPLVATALGEWIATHGDTWDANADDVSHACNYALRSSGSTHTYHACRHAFAMQLYDQTRDIALVSRALRHSSPAVTAIYAQTRDDQLAAAVGDMGTQKAPPVP